MFRLACFLVIAVALVATAVKTSAQSGYVRQAQADWLGDPCLVTNPPGPVHLVFNPNQYASDAAYRNKTDALALLAAAASIPPGDSFAPVADALKTAAKNKCAPALLQSAIQAAGLGDADPTHAPPANRAMPSAGSWQPERAPAPHAGFSWRLFFQRWCVFLAALFLLLRTIWRSFFEVEADDDFANYLATLASAHRWIFPVYLILLISVVVLEFLQIGNLFFSLSILGLALSIRRYYCDGDFINHPKAQKVHLAMRFSLIWLGWIQAPAAYLSNLSLWHYHLVMAWVVLALATIAFSQFYNSSDLAEYRKGLYFFLWGFLISGIVGGGAGYIGWSHGGGAGSASHYIISAAIVACLPLGFFFYRWSRRVTGDVFGGVIFDAIFSEGEFAQKTKRRKHLPEIVLLQHWRDGGDVKKAWRTASRHLFSEARALPVWLFAIETAVLYRRRPSDALRTLRRLCATEVFPYDHRMAAVQQTSDWMKSAGFSFDARPFQTEKPVLDPTGVTEKLEAKMREGRFGQAEAMLRKILADDSLNELAFTQLVRLYCQDMKKRNAAENLIAEAHDTFSPKVLDYLNASLDEWMRLPMRSTAKPKTLLGRFFQRNQTEPSSRKLTLRNNHASAPPKSTDPLEIYLDRVKQNQPAPPDTSGVHDKVEKLLLERRLGSAIELLKKQAEAEPENFDLWLRYAEAHGNHCGNTLSAEKIIQRMERSGHFKKAQMKKAHNQLKRWRKKHPAIPSGW
jgi:tetratricopeptide (TPR) repeat protein